MVGVPMLTVEDGTVLEDPRVAPKYPAAPPAASAARMYHFLWLGWLILAVVGVSPGERCWTLAAAAGAGRGAEAGDDGHPGLTGAGGGVATAAAFASPLYWKVTAPARACSLTAVMRMRNWPSVWFNRSAWIVARPAESVMARSVRSP